MRRNEEIGTVVIEEQEVQQEYGETEDGDKTEEEEIETMVV